MRLYAFQGVRFGQRVEDPGAMAGPPYDQINASLRDRLHRISHHVSHLSCPVPGDGEESAYEHAARLHQEWLNAEILVQDPLPRIYPYELILPDAERRYGVTALVGLEDPESDRIRPHELTVAKAVQDRLDLLRAMEVDLEPILLLADDAGAVDELVAADVAESEPLAEHIDSAGCRHRLYASEDAQRIAGYAEALRHSVGLIADGHHRYKVAGLHAAECGAEPGTPAAAKLAVITSLDSPALTIDPIHRGLTDPTDLESLRTFASQTEATAESVPQLAREVAEADQPALGVWQNGRGEVWRFDPSQLIALPAGRRELAVAVLHGVLLPALGLASEAATDGTVSYRSDPAELQAELDAGSLKLAFVLPPMQPETFAEAVTGGGLLPPKSTRFLPKVVSGLVWAQHSSELL